MFVKMNMLNLLGILQTESENSMEKHSVLSLVLLETLHFSNGSGVRLKNALNMYTNKQSHD